MYLEFIDLLRCPRAHESSSLVAALNRMDGRNVVEATLGCPVCGAKYSIMNGEALFDGDSGALAVAHTLGAPSVGASDSVPHTESAATMLAAFLDLTRPGKLALLAGIWAAAAASVAELTSARIIALDSPERPSASESIAGIRATPPLPLADRSLDGVALDRAHTTAEIVSDVGRLLHPRGRLVAGAELALPPQFRELARDANQVVAEYIGELVPLRR